MASRSVPAPDAMTRQRWARVFKNQIGEAQEARASWEAIQIKYDHANTDECPEAPFKTKGDGTIVIEGGRQLRLTYGEIFAENEAAIARLMKAAKAKGVDKLVRVMIEADVATDENV